MHSRKVVFSNRHSQVLSSAFAGFYRSSLFFAPLWDKISNAAAIQTIWIWAVSGVFAMSTSCHGLFTAEVKARVVYGLVQSRFIANDR